MKHSEQYPTQSGDPKRTNLLDLFESSPLDLSLFDIDENDVEGSDVDRVDVMATPPLHEQVPAQYKELAMQREALFRQSQRADPSKLISSRKDLKIEDASPWLLTRDDVLNEVKVELNNNDVFLLTGPTGMGKSHFVRAHLIPELYISSSFTEIIVIDCFNLRTKSARITEFDASCALYEGNDEALRTLLHDIGDDSPLRAFFSTAETPDTTLVCFEHIECLSNDCEIAAWFSSLVEWLIGKDMKVMLVSTTNALSNVISLSKVLSTKNITQSSRALDGFTEKDIARWWYMTGGQILPDDNIASTLFELSGGFPSILRDFGRFQESRIMQFDSANELVSAFKDSQVKRYSRELENVVEILLSNTERLYADISDVAREQTRNELLKTGLFVATENQLKFKSALHAERYDKLVKHPYISRLRGEYSKLGSFHYYQELIGDGICFELLKETEPRTIFSALSGILRQWGVENIRVYLRDSENSRLWLMQFNSKHSADEGLLTKVLRYEDWPDFSQAVDSGRVYSQRSHELFLPVTDIKNRNSILVYGELSEKVQQSDHYQRRLRVRSIWNLVLKLQPAIAHAHHMMEAKKDRAILTSNRHYSQEILRAKNDTRKIKNLLQNLNCLSIVMLERGLEKWFVALDKVYYQRESDLQQYMRLLEGSATGRLDQIAKHSSMNGLMLERDKLHSVFPRVSADDKFAVFLMPTTETTIIGFVISQETALRFDRALKERFEQVGWLAVA